MGIAGYALVIVIMEGYNFLLSILRLTRHVRFGISPIYTLILPFLSAVVALGITDRLLSFGGSGVSAIWVILKMVLEAAVFILIYTVLRQGVAKIIGKRRKKLN